MAKLIVTHQVENFDNWKKQFDAMQDLRTKFGCKGEHVYRGEKNPNEVAIITLWDNETQAKSYGQSNELKEGMKKAGVVSAPSISFAN